MRIFNTVSRMAGILTAAFFLVSCQSVMNTLPVDTDRSRFHEFMPAAAVEDSPYFSRLMETLDSSAEHERVKIEYLLAMTESSPFEFDRNGVRYGGGQTANHLRRKYRKQFREVTTAEGFIDQIATRSSQSGRYYLAFPGNGYAYYCRDLLKAELERIESAVEMNRVMEGRNETAG